MDFYLIIVVLTTVFHYYNVYSVTFDDDQARQKVDSTNMGLSFEGNKSAPDHFKLLERDGDWLLIGARDVVYNISMKNFTAQTSIFWPSLEEDVELCIMKGKSKEDCHNFVRVLARDNDTGVLVCGTNAYKPSCRHYATSKDGGFKITKEFPASGIAPYDPSHNSTAFYFAEKNEIYAGTVADFSGTDALISKRQIAQPDDLGLRTERSDIKCLNDPNFVSSFADKDHVYFWFREGAVEYMNCGKSIYSRVARVCKNDRGGPRANADTWTSFLKARLNCSIPGEYPFYFNEIEATSSIVFGNYGSSSSSSSELVYAVFNTPYSAIRGSAVCAFSMDTIRKIFVQSPFKSQPSPTSNWLPILRSQVPQPRPGDCDADSRQLSDEAANFVKKNSLLDETVQNFFTSPLIVQTGRRRFTQITVDAQVSPANGGHKYDVVFIGTDDGNVVKLINLSDEKETKTILIETIRVFTDRSSIKNMLIYRASSTDGGNHTDVNNHSEGRLIVVGDEQIRSLPLHNCQKMNTCSSCVRLQDPYCAWEMESKSCIGITNGDWTKGKFVQSVLHGASKACPIENDNFISESTLVDVPETPILQTILTNFETDTFQNQSSTNGTNVNSPSLPCKCPADANGKKSGHQRQITLIDGAINDSADDKELAVTLEKISDQPNSKSVYSAESLTVAVVVTMFVSLILGVAVGLRLSKMNLLSKWNKKKLCGNGSKQNKTSPATTTTSSKNQIIYANGGCKINAAGVRTSIGSNSCQPINAYNYETTTPTTRLSPSNLMVVDSAPNGSMDDDDVAIEMKIGDDSTEDFSNSTNTLPKDYKVKKTYL